MYWFREFDKKLDERSTFTEFLEIYNRQNGTSYELETCDRERPDCIAKESSGGRLAAELKRLVDDQKMMARNIQAVAAGKDDDVQYTLFTDDDVYKVIQRADRDSFANLDASQEPVKKVLIINLDDSFDAESTIAKVTEDGLNQLTFSNLEEVFLFRYIPAQHGGSWDYRSLKVKQS